MSLVKFKRIFDRWHISKIEDCHCYIPGVGNVNRPSWLDTHSIIWIHQVRIHTSPSVYKSSKAGCTHGHFYVCWKYGRRWCCKEGWLILLHILSFVRYKILSICRSYTNRILIRILRYNPLIVCTIPLNFLYVSYTFRLLKCIVSFRMSSIFIVSKTIYWHL